MGWKCIFYNTEDEHQLTHPIIELAGGPSTAGRIRSRNTNDAAMPSRIALLLAIAADPAGLFLIYAGRLPPQRTSARKPSHISGSREYFSIPIRRPARSRRRWGAVTRSALPAPIGPTKRRPELTSGGRRRKSKAADRRRSAGLRRCPRRRTAFHSAMCGAFPAISQRGAPRVRNFRTDLVQTHRRWNWPTKSPRER